MSASCKVCSSQSNLTRVVGGRVVDESSTESSFRLTERGVSLSVTPQKSDEGFLVTSAAHVKLEEMFPPGVTHEILENWKDSLFAYLHM